MCIIDRQVSAAYSCTFPNTLSSPPHLLLTKDLKKTFPPPSTNVLYHFIEQEHWLNTSLSHKPNLTLTIWLTSFFERIWPSRLYTPFCLLFGSKIFISLHCFVVLIFFVSFCKFDQLNWFHFLDVLTKIEPDLLMGQAHLIKTSDFYPLLGENQNGFVVQKQTKNTDHQYTIDALAQSTHSDCNTT